MPSPATRPRSSSAKFIPYDLRPAKQSERRILVDILKIGGDCGLPIADYRYVGMGGNRFYDYLLLHKYLGIRDMVSVEHDPVMFNRAEYNVPYGFIDVKSGTVAEFIAGDESTRPTIYWFDYDGGLGPDILRDVAALSMKIKLGDFCFVTVFGGVPGLMKKEKGAQGRLVIAQDLFGDFAVNLTTEDTETSNFHCAVHKVVLASFRNAFAPRTDGKFATLLQAHYSDSKTMVTVGGAFLRDGQMGGYRKQMQSGLPFLDTVNERLYEIESLNLTERERGLFDRAVTSKNRRSAERKKLAQLGFVKNDLIAYEELLRYLPRYVETIV